MRTLRFALAALLLASGVSAAQAQVSQSGQSRPARLSVTPANASDSRAPEIVISEPRKMRGIRLREKGHSLYIRGRILDDSEIVEATVNDLPLTLTTTGEFETTVPLVMGENTIVILAVDAAGNLGTDIIPVDREAEVAITGEYHALVIGINDYKGGYWPPLDNAVRDAQSVAEVLQEDYNFNRVRTLINEEATRENIIREVEWFADNLSEDDNLLIYYSGHGQFDDRFNRGYWVPIDAQGTSTADFIPNTDIQTYIRGIETKHTLLIADACFAGDVFRAGPTRMPANLGTPEYFQDMHDKRSRKAITSGDVEPVMDGGRDGHSVFTYYLLKALRENQETYIDAFQIFEELEIPVVNNSSQTPKFLPIRDSGDEGGQFVFVR